MGGRMILVATEDAINFGAHAATNLQLPAAAKALGLPEAFKNHGESLGDGLRDGLRSISDGFIYIALAITFFGILSSPHNRTTSECILLLCVAAFIFSIMVECNKQRLPAAPRAT